MTDRSTLRIRSAQTTLLRACALLALCSLSVGCVSGAWRSAEREDSIAAYYRFLRDHPDSRYTPMAEERLAFHKLKRKPSIEGFASFKRAYPASSMIAELTPLIEEQAFEQTRAAGAAEDYERFAEEFVGSEYATRARGNAVYLKAGGFLGNFEGLRDFAAQHPSSDFAAEALRSIEAMQLRPSTKVRRVGLRVEVPPTLPEGDRVRRTLIDAARKTYAATPIELVPAGGDESQLDALLQIRHSETHSGTAVSGTQIATSGVEARTIVSIALPGRETPAWHREFVLRVDARDHADGRSLLFEPRGAAYWQDFFVPVASWASDAVLRPKLTFDRQATGVDTLGDRAVVAFEDGSFEVLSLANPLEPARIADYRPKSHLESREQVRIVGDRIVLFGEDGLQAVRFGPNGPEIAFELARGAVGAVGAVDAHGDDLVVAGTQGLLWVKGDGSGMRHLMTRRMRGVATRGGMLVATDGESMYLATPRQFVDGRVTSQLRLPVGFEAERVRIFDHSAVVLGAGGAIVLDISRPNAPRAVHQVYSSTVGPVTDAARVASRVFLLGPRGLLVLGRRLDRVEEVLDVSADAHLVAMGRHLVALGGGEVQVVDASPYGFGNVPAARPPSSPAAAPSSKATSPPAATSSVDPKAPATSPAAAPAPAPGAEVDPWEPVADEAGASEPPSEDDSAWQIR